MWSVPSCFQPLCFLLLSVFVTSVVEAKQAKVFVPGESNSYEQVLGLYLSILEDSSDTMTLEDVMAAPNQFKVLTQSFPSLGFQKHTHWFHLQVDGRNLEAKPYLLHVDYAFLDELSFYEVHSTKIVQEFHTGDTVPFDSRPLKYETFLFPLSIQPGQVVDFYFRVLSTESILFPVQFFSRDEERLIVNHRSHIFGGLFGAMLLIVLYNFFLWLIIRDRAYLFYWLYLAGQSSFQFMYSGYAFRYWWPDLPQIQVASLVLGGVVVALLAIEFCRSYLQTRTLLQRSDQVLRAVSWLMVITVVPAYLWDAQLGMVGISIFSFIIAVTVLCIVFRLTFYERSPMGTCLFAAFSVLIISYCVTALAAFGWMEFSQFTLHLPPLAVVVEGALLSFGLGYRIRTLQHEKSKTLELLLEESTRAARLGLSAQRFVPHEFLEFLGRTDISEVCVGDSISAEMTVLFSDIRSFTTLSEGMTPKENFEFVNEYLQVVTPVIYKHGGFIDKFIGDAVMALFHEGSDQACHCALEIQKALGQYNDGRLKKGKDPVNSGIGIHTGSVMLGTVGDSKRLQTTVISDAVNLASRIEGLTKEYQHPVLVSEAVVDTLTNADSLSLECVDVVRVKGKAEETTVYKLQPNVDVSQ